jgi:hypothetical protein
MPVQKLVLVVTLSLVLPVATPSGSSVAMAQGVQKVQRVANFLGTAKRGKDVMSYLHFGSTYVDHEVIKASRVTDRDGQAVPGHFALTVVYDWKSSFGDNSTTVVFFFDEKGEPYEIQCEPKDSTSIISPPFSVASGAIQILGNLLIGAFGGQMNAKERADMQKAVDAADARMLLLDSLRVQIRLGL